MNKKKIISSLTMAGMLATSAFNTGVFADNSADPETKALGEYSKLITGKTVVPFILQSDSDKVTGKDLKISFPGMSVSVADDAELKTGDLVNINGNPRTLVIYGDTNSDGKVNILDSVATLNYVRQKGNLTDAQFVAADSNNDGTVNVLEAVNVLNVVKGKTPYSNIAKAPSSETEQSNTKLKSKEIVTVTDAKDNENIEIKLKFSADASGYTYYLEDDKENEEVTIDNISYDKDENEAKLTLNGNGSKTKLKVAEGSDKNVTYTLTVKDKSGKQVIKDTFKYIDVAKASEAIVEGDSDAITSSNQNKLSIKVTTESPMEEATTVLVTLRDSANREITGSANLPARSTAVSVNNFNNVSSLEDGTVYVKVKLTTASGNASEVDGKNIKKLQLVKSTKGISITDILSTRSQNKLTFTALINDDSIADNVTKSDLYYIVQEARTTRPSVDYIIDKGDVAKLTLSTDETTVNEVTVSNVTLNDNGAYKIYAVVKNDNGVVSDIKEANVVDRFADQVKEVSDVKVDTTEEGSFYWKDDDNESKAVKDYKAILYAVNKNEKSGDEYKYKAIAVQESTKGDLSVNFLDQIKEYAQDRDHEIVDSNGNAQVVFTVGVIAKAANSDYADSDEVRLESVADMYEASQVAVPPEPTIKIDEDNYHQILDWSNKEYKATDVALFKVSIYKYDETDDSTAKAKDPIKTVDVSRTQRTLDLTKAMKGLDEGKYAVTIYAAAASSAEAVDSAETKELNTYNISAPTDLTLELKSNNKDLTAKISKVDKVLKGDTLTYKLYKGIKLSSSDTDFKVAGVMKEDSNNSSLYSIEDTLDEDDTTYEAQVRIYYGTGKDAIEVARTANKEISTSKSSIGITSEENRAEFMGKWTGSSKDYDSKVNKGIKYAISYDGNKLIVTEIGSSSSSRDTIYKSNNDAGNYQEIIDIVKVLTEGDEIYVDSSNKDRINVIKTTKDKGSYSNALKNAELTINIASDESTSISAKSVYKVNVEEADYVDLKGAIVTDGVTIDANNVNNVDISDGTKVEIENLGASGIKINGVEISYEKTATDSLKLTVSKDTLTFDEVEDKNDITIVADDNITVKFVDPTTVNVQQTEEKKTLKVEGTYTELNVIGGAGKVDVSGVDTKTINEIDVALNDALVITNKELTYKVVNGTTTKGKLVASANTTITYTDETNTIDARNGKATYEFNLDKATNTTDDAINLAEGKVSDTYTLADGKTINITNKQGTASYEIVDNGSNSKKLILTVAGETIITNK